MNAMYLKDYRFRDVFLMTTAAEDEIDGNTKLQEAYETGKTLND